MSNYLTIVYRITEPCQPRALLDQAEWSASSHTHAIHDRDRLQQENEQLRQAVARLHAAKGRYHTQLAACDLYDLCGLPSERPPR